MSLKSTMRKDVQDLKLDSKANNEKKKDFSFNTSEGIKVKSSYSSSDIKDFEHLNYVAGITPNLRGPYSTMYVRRPWTIRQ